VAAENLRGRARLDDPAAVHDRDLVGDVLGDGEVVRYEHEPDAVCVAQVAQQVDHLRLD
jgi:hypothetical protein